MRVIYYLLLLFIVAICVSFAYLNSTPIKLNYFIGSAEISVAILVICSITLGVLLGVVVLLPSLFRAKFGNRQLTSQIRRVEQELNNLRSIPINDSH